MKIIYEKGIALEFWHDFYLGQLPVSSNFLPDDYDISQQLTLVPTQDCARILRNLRWILRPQPAGAFLFVDVQSQTEVRDPSADTFQSVVSIEQPYRLSFWLMASDRYFSNYTNLPLADARHQIYYFSNQWNNQQNGTTFLSQPLPTYAAGNSYALGQLVSHEGNTLEALRPIESAAAVPDPDDWEVLPASQYASGGDRLRKQKRYWSGNVSAANPGDVIRFRVRDGSEIVVFDTEITIPDNHPAGTQYAVSLDSAELPPGRYQLLQQQTVIDEFILADTQTGQTALALVEIFLASDSVAPELSPTRKQNQQTILQPQTYIIRFKNRATRWRYRYQRPHGCTPISLSSDFTLIDDRTYATTRPFGLRQQPDVLLVDCQNKPLPSPAVMQISPEIDDSRSVAQIFSDVYL